MTDFNYSLNRARSCIQFIAAQVGLLNHHTAQSMLDFLDQEVTGLPDYALALSMWNYLGEIKILIEDTNILENEILVIDRINSVREDLRIQLVEYLEENR